MPHRLRLLVQRLWTPRESIPYADPLRAGRHPFQTYLLFLCVISGLPLLFGHVTAGTINVALPHWLGVSWGGFLFFGSSVAMTGSYWRGKYENALTLERVGLIVAGAAGLAYSLVVLIALPFPILDRLTSTAMILGFGASCIRRSRDIGKIIHRATEETPHVVAREFETDDEAVFRDDGDV